jgi:5-methylcytosine-specific restriction enzyme subunit McrC
MTDRLIIAKDCSFFPKLSREDSDWLGELVMSVKPADLLLPLSKKCKDDEPVAIYDVSSGLWRAGRYVGEINYKERTLRIEPRFGMPNLIRWLGSIWGVKLIQTTGMQSEQRLWLWIVIAHLWSQSLIAAAKHGLPYRRKASTHEGLSLRGKLHIIRTANAKVYGDNRLIGITQERSVDPVVSSIILRVYDILSNHLMKQTKDNKWLPDRGKTIVEEFYSALGNNYSKIALVKNSHIRYTPITESYRSIVDLSLSILKQRPRLPSHGRAFRSYGILLDMAEIWEVYIAKLLSSGLPGFHVIHTGRDTDHFRWLLTSRDGETFGSLRPDILIMDNFENCVGIVDAKYKSTRATSSNPNGILREDLYQLAAYLSGFGSPERQLDGYLIYPEQPDGDVERRLSINNPWIMTSAPKRRLWFVNSEVCTENTDISIIHGEKNIVSIIGSTLSEALSKYN